MSRAVSQVHKIPPGLFEVRSDGVEGIAAEGHP
jgi:hypothetical protein